MPNIDSEQLHAEEAVYWHGSLRLCSDPTNASSLRREDRGVGGARYMKRHQARLNKKKPVKTKTRESRGFA